MLKIFSPLHTLKVILCAKCLAVLNPDSKSIIGQKVALELDEKKKEWEVALLSIQNELGEEFDGGILHRVPTVEALCFKVRKLYGQWRLYKLKVERVSEALQVNTPEVVTATKELVAENEELQEVKDAVLPALNSAARAIVKVEKIQEERKETNEQK
jgi:hypothetical protein